MKIYAWLGCLCSLVCAVGVRAAAQTPALLDDFARTDGPTVGNGWAETETAPPGSVALAGGQLRLASATAGRDFVARSVATRYNPVLGANPGLLTWAWNMRQSRADPSGVEASNYGAAFVLAASSANLLTADGYAVVYGNAGTPNHVRLVRFTGGLDAEANLTPLVTTAGTDYGSQYLTLRVTFAPAENTWTLYVAASTAFADPLAGTAVPATGATADATLTGQSLAYVGCLWDHATSSTDHAVFDNVYVTAPCALAAEPAQSPAAGAPTATAATAALAWAAGSGTDRLLVVRAGGPCPPPPPPTAPRTPATPPSAAGRPWPPASTWPTAARPSASPSPACKPAPPIAGRFFLSLMGRPNEVQAATNPHYLQAS